MPFKKVKALHKSIKHFQGPSWHFRHLYEFILKGHDGHELECFSNFSPKEIPSNRPLLIFNNGLVCGPSWWIAIMQILEKENIPMVFYHYRGHFGDPLDYPISVDLLAKDCCALVQHFNHSKTILIGHSMGVNVALKTVLICDKNIQGLVLMGGSPLPPEDFLFRTGLSRPALKILSQATAKVPIVNNLIWKSTPYNPLAWYLVHLLGTNNKRTPITTVMHYLKELGQMPPKIFWELLHSMHDAQLYYQVNQIETPTLMIGGELDLLCPIESQKTLLRKLKNAKGHFFKDAGHVPQTDYPEKVASLILSFIL